MAGTVVAMPMAGASQQPQFTTNPPGSVATNFQAPRPGAFAMPSIPDASQRGPRPFNRSHQFRPRFSMNKGGEDDSGMYDGKRMRKAIHRKTVDYNPSVIKFLENRVWQRDGRDEHRLQPDSLYSSDLIPPPALLDDPLNCVNTKFVRTSTNKFRCPIFCLTWTPEGRRLVTGASSGEFTLWNGLTFNFETILQAHETAVRAMRWSHSDSWMVTADHAGYIKYWQSNMNNVKMFQAHKEPIRGISFCPTDSKFASCSDDGTVRVWDFMRCQEERILRGHGADVRCVDWHPQKSLLASGSKDNQQPVKLWDPRTGNSLATLHAHKHTVMDLKWHTNGNWMLTASRDHLLKLFDTRNLKEELQTFKGHKREATAIGWHPVHEGLFASGSADGALMFWMVGCDHEVGGMEQAHEGMVWSLAWHPLGHILASGSNDHATKFWTRNRPGDEMRDKYNLNLLPSNMVDPETNDPVEAESVTPNLPGMGLEHGVAEHLQVKEEKKEGENELPSIPGLNWEEDSILLKAEERAANKKVPYARPVPKMFEQAWAGEIDIEQIKKEQQAKQQAKQAAQTSMNQPTLLLAQQMIGALTGALRQQLAGMPGGHMLLRPGGPLMLGNLRNPLMGLQAGRGPAPPGPLLLLQQAMGIPQPAQDGENSSGGAAGSSNGSGNTNKGSQSSQGTPGSNSQNTSADQGGAKPPTSTPSESSGQTGPHQGTSSGPAFQQPPVGPPPVRMGAPQAPMGGNMQQGQIRGPRPQGQMGGPPQGQMGGPPPGQMGGPPPGQMGGPPPGQMGGPPPGQMGGPPPGQMGGPPPGQMGGPPPGQMGGPPLQGNRGNVPQGHMDGPPPQGQRGGPSQGQMSGPLQGQIVGPQGQRSGPQQGQMGGPPQGQMVGPPQGQMSGPPQNQRSGPPQGHMGGPQQGPPQGQMHGPPHGGPMRRPLGAANQPQGPRPQGPAGGQRPRGPASEEMDTDERYNMQGPGRGPPSAELDEDFRAQRVYNGPAGPTGHAFSGEDQDLRQGGPPPPPPQSHQHHPKYNKPGPPQRHPRGQATAAGSGGGFDDYGDTDERMGDTGDYDYRKEGAGGGRGRGVGGRGRGGAPPPHKDNFQGRQPGGYGNYSGAGDATQGQGYDESEEYEKGGGGGGEWGDYGESYNEEYYDDYNNGYGGGGGGEGGGYQEHAPPPPHPGGRKRVWEEGPGQDRGGRGRARARGWGRGAQGESWGRGGSRGGYRGGPPPPAPRGGFRGRGAPWQRGGPGGDRGSGRGRGGYRGGY